MRADRGFGKAQVTVCPGAWAGHGVQRYRAVATVPARPEFVYRRRWSPDDIAMWDNRCTMHRVTPYDPAERRVMHRTTIVGDGPAIAA